MPDQKISELTSYTTPLDADVLPIVDTANSSTKKVTWANVKATLSTSLGGANAYDFIVYRSGGNTIATKTSDGSTLSTNTDAAVVLQACIDQIDASTGIGGGIYIKPGTYSLASTVTLQGDQTSDSKMIRFHGSGVQTTIFAPASGVNGITLSNRLKISIGDFAVYVRGGSDGIKATNSSVGQRSFWQSEFRNIYIYGDNNDHTGWGMNLENPFRSTFDNIEMNQVNNGLLLKAIDTSTNYNPGDCTFNRMFIELRNVAGGVAYQLNSPSTGDMNQVNFNMCEGYGGGTGQTGILLDGTSGSVNHTRWNGINLENFDIILDVQKGISNEFAFNYIVTRDAASTTYFRMTANATNNFVSTKYLDTYTRAVTIVNDSNNTYRANVFENIMLEGSATATTFTVVGATILRDIKDNALGTSAYLDVSRTAIQDPGADRLFFWDDSAGLYTHLTLGTNLSISGTTINATGGGGGTGLTWSEVTGTTQSASVNNGYVVNNASLVTVTIPTTAAVGEIVRIVGKGAGGWRVSINASEVIHFGDQDSTTGVSGYLASTNRYDCVELVCIVANSEWVVGSSLGNITVV